MKIAETKAYRDRAPKQVQTARCCWVCGKLGGEGFTHFLRSAGYRMRLGEMGYAHARCMARAAKEAADKERKPA